MSKKKTIAVLILSMVLELFLRLDFSNASVILTELRIPRMILSFAVGASLALSGLIMQTVLQNPLADPYTLGVASGAALGAAIVQSFGIYTGIYGLNGGAALGALVVLGVFLKILSRTRLRFDSVILVGLMLSFTCSSFLAIWSALADPVGVQSVTFWLLGDLSRARLQSAGALLFLSIVFFAYFYRFSRKLDAFLLGESMVEGFGVSLTQTRLVSVILISILVGFCVSASGMIGFVGLMVPHLVRKKLGTSLHQSVLPHVFVWGGSVLMLSDSLAHGIAFPTELPVGAVTAVLGAPAFVYLFIFQKRGQGVNS